MEDSIFGRSHKSVDPCTEEQKKAIECGRDIALVIAGAGAGKTFVLAKRLEYLLKKEWVKPDRAILLAFSNKSTRAMRTKVFEKADIKITPNVHGGCHIYTLHKFCMNFLWDEGIVNIWGSSNIVTDKRNIWIYRDLIHKDLQMKHITRIDHLIVILRKARWIMRKEKVPFTKKLIDRVYEFLRYEGKLARSEFDKKYSMEDISLIYRKYDEFLAERKLFTFDDILLSAYEILRDNVDVRKKWSSRFDAILMDEFQDVDDVQLEIVKCLTGPHTHLFCVGDPDQSIYGFRGAVPGIFKECQNHFEDIGRRVEILYLTNNFRSSPQVLDTSNSLINSSRDPNRFAKVMRTTKTKEEGECPKFLFTDCKEKEAELIVKEILFLNYEKRIPLNEIVVLGRNWRHLNHIEKELLRANIHYDFARGGFVEDSHREEIRDLIAWMNIAISDNKEDLVKSIKRVINKPTRGIGPKKVSEIYNDRNPEQILNYMNNNTNPHIRDFVDLCYRIRQFFGDNQKSSRQKMEFLLSESGFKRYYEEKSTKLNRTMSIVENLCREHKDMYGFREGLQKWTAKSLDGNDVLLSTIHGVKGLEFSHVFLVSFSDRNLPSDYARRFMDAIGEEKEVEDELRLAYVALTRAKVGLCVSTHSGKDDVSRFFAPIARHFYVVEDFTPPEGDINLEMNAMYDTEWQDDLFDQQKAYEDRVVTEEDDTVS